jgi:hypothetical protein
MKKIVITGATGSIGRILMQKLIARKDEVIIFTRNTENARKKSPNTVKYVKWDYKNPEEWKDHLNGVDTVIHLAGANLSSKRWNEEFKKLAYDSRVLSTRNLVQAISFVEKKPKTFICASAVGYFGNRYDEILNEESLPGNDYMANLCKDWEAEAAKVEQFGVRRISVRTGLVLSKDEGVLKQLYLPFKLFVGGPLGNGRQWFPWIQIDDIVGIYLQAIDNADLTGAVNAASPGIVRMNEFAKTFGKVLHRPSLFKIPKFAMKIVAGEVADYAVMSQRISANKILNAGYKFKFENLEEALRDLFNK